MTDRGGYLLALVLILVGLFLMIGGASGISWPFASVAGV